MKSNGFKKKIAHIVIFFIILNISLLLLIPLITNIVFHDLIKNSLLNRYLKYAQFYGLLSLIMIFVIYRILAIYFILTKKMKVTIFRGTYIFLSFIFLLFVCIKLILMITV